MEGPDVKRIGKEIKIRRIRNRITQKELAGLLGISQTHLSNVENGRTMLGISSLLEIKRYLGCTLDDLLEPDMESRSTTDGKHIKRYKLVPYE